MADTRFVVVLRVLGDHSSDSDSDILAVGCLGTAAAAAVAVVVVGVHHDGYCYADKPLSPMNDSANSSNAHLIDDGLLAEVPDVLQVAGNT